MNISLQIIQKIISINISNSTGIYFNHNCIDNVIVLNVTTTFNSASKSMQFLSCLFINIVYLQTANIIFQNFFIASLPNF